MRTLPTVNLNNGIDFPLVGFGVAGLDKGEILDNAIDAAIEEGFRYFDCAPFYGNEKQVGAALDRNIKNGKVTREELFVSTKLPNWCHAYNDAITAFHQSRELMGLDYLDMYLIHHPMPAIGKFKEAWKALEDLHEQGYIKTIGISNFKDHHIEELMTTANICPATNELEINPYFTQAKEREWNKAKGIRVINWFPLGGPLVSIPPIPPRPDDFVNMLKDEVLVKIGEKYGKTSAQVTLRWAIDTGMTPIPKSGKPARIKENADLFDFELTADEIQQIEALNQDRRLAPDPDFYNDLSTVAMDV